MKTSNLVASPGQQFQSSLVQEIVVTAPTDRVTFAGLDSNIDKGYYLEYELINALTAAQSMGLYVNGDLTDANYHESGMYNTYTGSLTADYANTSSAPSLLAAVGTVIIGTVFITNFDGYFHALCNWQSMSTTNTPFTGFNTLRRDIKSSSIFQLDVLDKTGSGIGIGSRLRLMRRNQNILQVPSSGMSNLVQKTTLTADSNTITFAGLNSLVDGSYSLELDGVGSAAGSILMSINNDFTDVNYAAEVSTASGSSMTCAMPSSGTYRQLSYFDSGTPCQGRFSISVVGGKVIATGLLSRYQSGTPVIHNLSVIYKTAITAITSITLTTATGNMLTGTVARLYKSVASNSTTGMQTSPITTATQALVNRRYLCDTSNSFPFNLTLPQSPQQGDQVEVIDARGTFGSNAVTVVQNGAPIDGVSQDLVLDVNNVDVVLVYVGGTKGWTTDIGSNQVLGPVPYFPVDVSTCVTDYLLKVGETVYRTFSALTSVPLHIAIQEGEYEIILQFTTPDTGSSSILLAPNNTTYTGKVKRQSLLSAGTTVGSNAATEDSFAVGGGSLTKCTISITTTTVFKVLSVTGALKIPGYNVYNTSIVWEDTTTIWASLGTLTSSYAMTGKAIIRRIL